jgi:serine/threonine protein kinase
MRAQPLSTERNGFTIGNAAPQARASGSAAARWHPVEWLGRGGAAEVWRAVDATGRVVALKKLRSKLRGRPGAVAYLERENEWLQTLEGGPFVISYGLIEHEESPALVLEYLPGGDLVSLLGASPRHWLPALRTVTAAVAALHSRGVAHGDLKARNVLFASDGAARIIDLTSVQPIEARAERTTAAYRPADRAVTAGQADCFALAVLSFELLTGRLPFGPAGQTVVGQQPTTPASADSTGAALAAAVCRGLAAGGREGLSPLSDVIESVGAG